MDESEPMLSTPDWLYRQAQTIPNRVALIADGSTWTWPELNQEADRIAGILASLGIRRGDHVGLLMGNSGAFARLVHGLMRLRAVLVPLNVRLTDRELSWQMEDAGIELLVYDRDNATKALMAARPEIRTLFSGEIETNSAAVARNQSPARIDLRAVHCIVYTSGTTGQPKGAMLTYGNHWWNATGSALNLGTHRNDRWLACMPLFHVGGLAILMRSVIYGVPAIIHGSFDAAAVNLAIDEQGVTIVSVVSNMLQRMIEQRGEKPYPASLRCMLLGGGPAPLSLLKECARRHVPVLQTYGLTETSSQSVTLAPEDALRKLGSAGKPLMPVEIRIESEGHVATPGQPGEILVRGPNVTTGYYRRDTETARALRDGWLHTGDAGYLDTEGYLYVLDRRNDLIISGGENVYPAEVEAALASHPSVLDAGVTGKPDERWGETVVASVVLQAGRIVSEEELRAHCMQRLAKYKVPSEIRFVDSLPRTASGKLLRRVLRGQHTPTPSKPNANASDV